jgi:Mlc titration factor MtfA (ptsG expression regulator)
VIRLLVMLVAGGMYAAGFALGRVAIRRLLHWRATSLPSTPVPTHWPGVIRERVPIVLGLSEQQRTRLLSKVQELARRVRWEGCGGLQLTEEMQLTIAAQACLLVLEHEGEPYPDVDEVLVYPTTFVPRLFSWTPAADREIHLAEPTLGEAWRHGVVVLAWDSAAAGAADPADGHNVVLHEFAHQLDGADGAFDGRPQLGHPSMLMPWTTMLEREYARLCEQAETGTDGALNHYGATDPAEFFAVATEAFFERPVALRQERPELYEALRRFYRQTPESYTRGAA